jgi:EpsI family protein
MISRYRQSVIYLLLIGAVLFIHLHEDLPVPVHKPLGDIPIRLDEWHMVRQIEFSPDILEVLQPTDYLSRIYQNNDGHQVALYLGYHGGGPGSGSIHSPKHCLPGSGWEVLEEKETSLLTGKKRIFLMEATYQNGENRQLFMYWYQVRGKTIANIFSLRLAEIYNSIFHNRRDSAFIRISMPFDENIEPSRELARRFIGDFYRSFDDVLPDNG